MKNLFTFLVILFFTQTLSAQNIAVSDKIDATKGQAIEPNTVWNMTSAGGNLHLVFNTGGANISSKTLTVNIDQLFGGVYKSYDIKKIKVDNSKSWASIEYFFKDAGQYKISFLDSSYKELANTEIAIKMIESKAAEAQTAERTHGDPFKAAFVEFGNSIDTKGKLSGKNDTFTIGPDGGTVKVKVTNAFPFGTTKFFVDTYKRNRKGNYEIYESKNFPIYAENSTWIYFSYLFAEPGTFKLAIYTKENKFVSSGVVTLIQP